MESIVSALKRKDDKKRYQLRYQPKGRPGTKVDAAKAPAGNKPFETRLMRAFFDAATTFCRKGGKTVDSGTSMEELLVAFDTATFISGEFICSTCISTCFASTHDMYFSLYVTFSNVIK